MVGQIQLGPADLVQTSLALQPARRIAGISFLAGQVAACSSRLKETIPNDDGDILVTIPHAHSKHQQISSREIVK